MRAKRSLHLYLMGSLGVAVIVPLLVIGWIVLGITADALKKEIVKRNQLIISNLVQHIEDHLQQHEAFLQALKSIAETVETDRIHLSHVLNTSDTVQHDFIKFQIIDKDGLVTAVVPYDEQFMGLDMSRRDFFQVTRRTGQPYWSQTFISSQFNRPVVTLSVPFGDGVLTGYLSLSKLTRTVKKISIGEKSFVAITDQTGTFIAHPDEEAIFQRRYEIHYKDIIHDYRGGIINRMVTFDGQETMIYAAFITQTGWAILVYQSIEEMFASIRKLSLILSAIIFAMVLVALFIGYRNIRTIMATLKKFMVSADIITSGRYDEVVKNIRYKEFQALSDKFNYMAQAIKTREVELKENEEKYRSIFKAAKDAIVLLDHQSGQVLDVNDFACSLYGYSREEFLHLKHTDLSSEPEKTISGLNTEVNWIPIRNHRKKDGTVFPVEISVNYHYSPHGQRISTSIIRDISARMMAEEEKKKMEAVLRQSQKMESIGTLAGGIAHDFNNILGAIIGYTELSILATKADSEAANLHKVLQAANRAKDLVNQILAFSRQTDQELKPVVVSAIAKEALKLLRASLPSTIEIRKKIQTDAMILGDPTQIHQILMNLCTNAGHAMQDSGGILEVDLKLTDLDAEFTMQFPDLSPGRYLHLTVSDSGVGMPPAVVDRIFEPFFTTKERGKGTGMGLAVVHGIVKRYGGAVHVFSELGKGSCFQIFLPSIEEKPEPDHPVVRDVPGGKERILFVDDEEDLSEIAQLFLEYLGYHVITRTSSLEALDLFRDQSDQFDLVITDMTMPNLTGDELVRHLRSIRPDIPVILCTGFSEKINSDQAEAMGLQGFLRKPLLRSEMARTVRQVLDMAVHPPESLL